MGKCMIGFVEVESNVGEISKIEYDDVGSSLPLSLDEQMHPPCLGMELVVHAKTPLRRLVISRRFRLPVRCRTQCYTFVL